MARQDMVQPEPCIAIRCHREIERHLKFISFFLANYFSDAPNGAFVSFESDFFIVFNELFFCFILSVCCRLAFHASGVFHVVFDSMFFRGREDAIAKQRTIGSERRFKEKRIRKTVKLTKMKIFSFRYRSSNVRDEQ